jgi:hypothetical protein
LSDPNEAIAGTFVEPRGMIRSIVAGVAGREVLGALGGAGASAAASRGTGDASPLSKGQIAYLGVFNDELTMFRAKRGAFRPKPTNEMIASAPRSDVRAATVEKGRLAGVLEIGFDDGQSWSFAVPKVHLAGAAAIVASLTQG